MISFRLRLQLDGVADASGSALRQHFSAVQVGVRNTVEAGACTTRSTCVVPTTVTMTTKASFEGVPWSGERRGLSVALDCL